MAFNNKRKGHRVSSFLSLKSTDYIAAKFKRCKTGLEGDRHVHQICTAILRDRGIPWTSRLLLSAIDPRTEAL
jgi:hypothetical protein